MSDPLCGSTVVVDLVLDHDILCHNTNGLTVVTEGITIDLNGRTIECVGCKGSRLVGINASEVGNLVIKGPGTIIGFERLFVKGDNRASGGEHRLATVGTRSLQRPRAGPDTDPNAIRTSAATPRAQRVQRQDDTSANPRQTANKAKSADERDKIEDRKTRKPRSQTSTSDSAQ
jgi:hypothetical protein